jgi:prephenate dehydratase/chorismate mutase
MSLDSIRKNIDLKDSQILKLLHERMELALMSKKFKSAIEDQSRESELFEKITAHTGVLVSEQFSYQLYELIINESKKIQQNNYSLIGYQGERGAYSELAAMKWNNEYVTTACQTWNDVFDGVKSGLYDFGIVPIENTLGGVVNQTNDLMIHSDLFIVGAVEMEVHHCLLALPDTDHREIRTVYSHQQALSQCRHFLARNGLEGVPYYNTAGAAKMLLEKRPAGSAVIAGRNTAEIYNLEILKENIEDLETNRTRFLLIAREEAKDAGNKCSVLFTTAHKAGTLFNVLEIFAKENINLTRIESIPDKPGTYAFFVDFEGNKEDPVIKKVMEDVKKFSGDFKFMGCYREIHAGDE